MTDKKPIIIDLCKIGFGFWILVSTLLIVSSVSFVSAGLSEGIRESVEHSNCQVPIRYENAYCSDNKLVIENYCYRGIFDTRDICNSEPYRSDFWLPFLQIGELMILVNGFNWYLWFVVLNRKYGKYEFKFKKCNGDFV